MNTRIIVTLLLSLFSVSTVFSEKLSVVVSIAPQRYFVERVAGDLVEVEVLIPEGADPHSYQATARQMSFVSTADVFFRMGLPFEEFLIPKISDHLDGPIIDMRDGLELLLLQDSHHEHHHHHGHCEAFDPHTWLAPDHAKLQAKLIATTLVDLDPDHADIYNQKLGVLLKDLSELDQYLTKLLSPLSGKKVLVFHPSWGYFLNAYGMEQVSVEQNGRSPSAKHLVDLIQSSTKDTLSCLLVQPEFNQRLAESVSREIGLELVETNPLAEDYIINLREMAKSLVEAGQNR